MPTRIQWQKPAQVESRSFTCGHCGNKVASKEGWEAKLAGDGRVCSRVYICHECGKTTLFDIKDVQHPSVRPGSPVRDVDDESVSALYEEARSAVMAGANTAAVLACRKLLMHIAVAKGAKAGENFTVYVKFLSDNHYVPPDASQWVDHIRKKGNEANHEINVASSDDSQELVSFVEMLLRLIYEFPAKARRTAKPGGAAS